MVEGAFIRFMVRIGESVDAATEIVRVVHQLPRCDFWADSVSYIECDVDHVLGHQQVTDAYLASLAATKHGRFATLDEGLAATLPDAVTLLPLLGR